MRHVQNKVHTILLVYQPSCFAPTDDNYLAYIRVVFRGLQRAVCFLLVPVRSGTRESPRTNCSRLPLATAHGVAAFHCGRCGVLGPSTSSCSSKADRWVRLPRTPPSLRHRLTSSPDGRYVVAVSFCLPTSMHQPCRSKMCLLSWLPAGILAV